VAQLLRFLFLQPLTKYVAEGVEPKRVAATGVWLYALGCTLLAAVLVLGRDVWAGLFRKPDLAMVLVPSAALLLAGSLRDGVVATMEGLRRLQRLFWLDVAYYGAALAALGLWRWTEAPRTAVAIQWVQAVVGGIGSLLAVGIAWRALAARPDRVQARRIVAFGRGSFATGLGTTVGQHADVLLAGALMEPRAVASYQVAKLFFRAFNVLAQAINQVIMPLVSKLHAEGRQRDLRILYEKSVCFVHLGVVPLVVVLLLLAPQVYQLFYGERYAESIPVFRILVASALALPFASIGSPFLVGLGRLRSLMWITWLGMGVAVGLAFWWIPAFGAVGAAAALLVAAIVGMVGRTVVLRRILGFTLWDVARRVQDARAFVQRQLRLS
jgi:O-antigen/teichoic acid export membrane protein